MDFAGMVSEERIKKAMAEGEFDHLPGKGKPLVLEDLSAIPPELRMAYSMMKNAKMMESEEKYRKEMLTIEELIACCQVPEERGKLQEKLNQKLLHFNKVMEKRKITNSSFFKKYENKIASRLRD
ncbi:DnaJ family domain-containing protein [Bacillus sp. MUM 13]|uniref:DnaJ family domain-containing protein n=1 Tax=Bacillus sp. MUM 13 TaxID=1678001 RepID=UPI0008F5C3EF|nr:DnaJ family domain-containing protein [Bacillus sp. MUM 13]OIK11664.1 DUF1992 domain-containing protein [Bacillus sp. MUM 13]